MGAVKHFITQELVSPEAFALYGDRCLAMFPAGVLDSLSALREAFGAPITCNDWHANGSHKYSGQRPQTCPIGAKNSQHKLWMAFDLRAHDMDALRGLICARGREFGVTRMEASFYTPTWVHIDFKPTGSGKLYIFTP